MSGQAWATILEALDRQARETMKAYMTGVPGFTDADIQDAAKRVLAMRRKYEQATGKRDISRPDSAGVARYLRSI
jgi:hypothetical protein